MKAEGIQEPVSLYISLGISFPFVFQIFGQGLYAIDQGNEMSAVYVFS